ncbi:MAG: GspMb/PilO family protein [Planctomycetota bacterium]|nr:GspMb/PilO family protein [Planctomycetota bacterium]
MSGKLVRALLVMTGLLTLGLSGMVWRSNTGISESRQEAEELAERILAERARLVQNPGLEQDVLVFREISGRMAAILPDEEGLNDLVRSLQGFSEDSGVNIRSLRRAARRGVPKHVEDFREVSYSLELEGDTFELLAFLDLVERHDRFLRVPRLKIDAARRQFERGDDGSIKHTIRLDVETFVFEPGSEAEPVAIEWADWKLDRLRGEVSERRRALEPQEYDYRGRRGRRDPWVDPRREKSPRREEAQPDQSEALVGLSERVADAWSSWRALGAVESSLEEARLSEELEVKVVGLETETRRLSLSQGAATSELDSKEEQSVLASLRELRLTLDEARGNRGPSIAHLREVHSAMEAHAERGEHALALQAFSVLEPDLSWLAEDEDREPLVVALRAAAASSGAVVEFDALGFSPDGVAILNGNAAVLIAGRPIIAGESLSEEVVIRSVTSSEVVFEFRGVAIARRVHNHSPKAGER